jgi:hypothetical protein
VPPAIKIASPIKRMFSQGVSVFGNSPPEVEVGDGAITGVSLGVAEGVGVAVSVGVAVCGGGSGISDSRTG